VPRDSIRIGGELVIYQQALSLALCVHDRLLSKTAACTPPARVRVDWGGSLHVTNGQCPWYPAVDLREDSRGRGAYSIVGDLAEPSRCVRVRRLHAPTESMTVYHF